MSRLRPLLLLAGGTAVVATTLGVGGYVLVKPYMMPADFEGAGSGTVTVKIDEGATAREIASVLADAGVVASARSFVRVTEEQAKGKSLRPGYFKLRKGMSAAAALKLLVAPESRVVRRVTIPEGLRLTELLDKVATGTGMRRAEFAKATADRQELDLPAYAESAEGFLFPATYEVEPDMAPAEVLAAMVERYRHAAGELDLEEKAAKVRLTPLEVVTVASILQAEGGRDSDYPKIARVIYNRIRARMPLQLDTTVLYAQKRRSLKVTEKDTRVKSPYNTYLRPGLPPGPIANPGEKALRAALHPDQGDWLWFVTTDPEHRITKFTDKESEFVRYREELNRYLGTR
ncbi:endolytic transglycosylase MltG [Streptosporangium sp. NBC_01756]|uniref:endolytic transglycosylase MltG n=1 Tax=Streptosporangium sp. NBC_01756 TaxID=2975950 RepID=UPI002DDC648D|nr:endolytic transglycosylase MltG [Streptosporangium sp. NBC_01756]WSC87235.1 endolytic transglycosylase MltG [Streptosporangium sp. NBC_01756]